MEKTIYLDNAATTKIDEEVLREMIPYLTNGYGNASSLYNLGRMSRNAIENARAQVARAINCVPDEIYFTSCGSESDNLAIKGIAEAYKKYGKHIIVSNIEHPAVLETCKSLERNGFSISYIPVQENGIIDTNDLKKLIRKDTILISVMMANNEVGTIQPIEEIGMIARNNRIIFHTDAVQAVGHVKIDVRKMNIDALSMSGHKFHAPKGIGALYVRNGIKFIRQQDGGHQEKQKRSGTENVASIVGLGKAIEIATKNIELSNQHLLSLRNLYVKYITNLFRNIHINGDLNKRLPGNINISFLGNKGVELVKKLDQYGIAASSGSACSSGLPMPSHVLMNMLHDTRIAESSLRITFGKENTIHDVDKLVKALLEIVK